MTGTYGPHPALTPACGGHPAGGLVNACARPGAGVLGLAAGLMAVMSVAPLVQQVTSALCRLPHLRSAMHVRSPVRLASASPAASLLSMKFSPAGPLGSVVAWAQRLSPGILPSLCSPRRLLYSRCPAVSQPAGFQVSGVMAIWHGSIALCAASGAGVTSLLWKGQMGALTTRALGAGAAKASKADVEAQVGSPLCSTFALCNLLCCLPLNHAKHWDSPSLGLGRYALPACQPCQPACLCDDIMLSSCSCQPRLTATLSLPPQTAQRMPATTTNPGRGAPRCAQLPQDS